MPQSSAGLIGIIGIALLFFAIILGMFLANRNKADPELKTDAGERESIMQKKDFGEKVPAPEGETLYTFLGEKSPRRCPYCDGEYKPGATHCVICGGEQARR